MLFVDLVGFTPLSETKDPESVRELLSQYFDVARTVIGRYGGVIEKFIGDAVMAVWGTPVATEGDTERAVRAALDLIEAVRVLGGEIGSPALAARAGVVTGEVAVTLGATGEGMVAGDAVNTAARVQAVAGAGKVLVDATTRRLTARSIGFEDAGVHELKGKAVPEQLWVATRVLSAVGGAQRVDGLEAPLIGREAELRTIKDLFHASGERRVPRLLVVSGPAGVGKSRLGWEFEKYADGVADSVLWHRGRCLSYGEEVAFWALAEIVRQRLGIAEEDTSDIASAKLATGLVAFVPDAAEREYVAVRLGRLLGVPVEADRQGTLPREELFAGWRLFFERLALIDPVVMLIEDAQHADPGLLDFLDHLVDWARELPIFVLVFARPELEQVRPGFGTGRNRATLNIDPLAGPAMEALVDSLVPGMPASARGAITAHSQGIPLFAVETVRSLIDKDVVVPRDGVYTLVGDVTDLSVPDSLHGLLAARLDALDPSTRALVADASVLGSSFPAEALVALSGRDATEVTAELADLVRRDVLEVSADPLSPQRGAYRFAQEMLRQVAYDTLSRRDRKARHLGVAKHLRTVFPNDGEEISDVIARHYLDALSAAPEDDDADRIADLALAVLVRAGERAERAGAPARASASYAAAAELGERAAAAVSDASAGNDDNGGVLAAARLWERATLADRSNDDLDGTVAHAEAARRLYLQLGDRRGAARVQTVAGHVLGRFGRMTEARTELSDALTVLRGDPDTDTVEALGHLAAVAAFDGSADGEAIADEAMVLGQALDVDSLELAQLFVVKGIVNSFANRTAEASACYGEAVRLAERGGDLATASQALLNLSGILTASDPLAGAEVARTAINHARRTGQRMHLSYGIANLAVALLEVGAWDEMDAVLTEAVESDGLGDHSMVGPIVGLLGALRGDSDRARTVLESMAHRRVSDDLQDQAIIGLLEAATSASVGRHEDVLTRAHGVLGLSETLGVRHETIRWSWTLAARAARTLGDDGASAELLTFLESHPIGHLTPIMRAEGDLTRACALSNAKSASATTAMADALSALRLVGSPYHLAHGLLDQTVHLARVGDLPAAEVAREEAASIGSSLKCLPLLRRAEDLAREAAGVA